MVHSNAGPRSSTHPLSHTWAAQGGHVSEGAEPGLLPWGQPARPQSRHSESVRVPCGHGAGCLYGNIQEKPFGDKDSYRNRKKIKHMNKETLERIFNNHSHEAKRESWC